METKPANIGIKFSHNSVEYEVTGILADALLVKNTQTGKIFNLGFENAIYKEHFIPNKPKQKQVEATAIDWGNRENIYIDTLLKISDEVGEYTAPAVLAKVFSARNTRAFITIFGLCYLYRKHTKYTQKQVAKASDENPSKISSFKHITDEQLAQIATLIKEALLEQREQQLAELFSVLPNNEVERAICEVLCTKNGIKENRLQFYFINNEVLKAFIKEFTEVECVSV